MAKSAEHGEMTVNEAEIGGCLLCRVIAHAVKAKKFPLKPRLTIQSVNDLPDPIGKCVREHLEAIQDFDSHAPGVCSDHETAFRMFKSMHTMS